MFTKESIKQFLRLDWKKVLLVILFLILSVSISGGDIKQNESFDSTAGIHFDRVSDEFFRGHGFPVKWLTVKYVWGYVDVATVNLNLVTNIIFWYFVSCLLIFAWDKIRKKPVV
jgi:hypothetical protein